MLSQKEVLKIYSLGRRKPKAESTSYEIHAHESKDPE